MRYRGPARPWFRFILVLAVAGFVAGYFYAGTTWWQRPGPVPGPGSRVQAGRPEKPSHGEVIGPATVIVREILYQDCGVQDRKEEPAGQDLLGLNRDQLSARWPGARIVLFTADRVIVSETRPRCPDAYRYRTLFLENGRVVVYYGTRDERGPLLRVTGVTAAHLLPADRDRLEKGLVVDGDAQLLQTLEGLTAD